MFKTLGLIACLTISAITTRGADIIIIPVTFKDLTNSIGTQVEIGTVMTNFWTAYFRSSYGTSLDITLADPVALSGNADTYTTKHQISNEAQAQTPNHVNFDTVITMNNYKFNDSAEIGGRLMWLQTLRVETMLHEYGHIIGLGHANLWAAYGDTITGPGVSHAYGNGFDWMGPDTPGGWLTKDYSFDAKCWLGWIPPAQVLFAPGSGTYRIYAYDVPQLETNRFYGLVTADLRTVGGTLVVSYKGLQDKLLVETQGNDLTNALSIINLLDMNPNTHWDNDYIDAGLELGRSLSGEGTNPNTITAVAWGDGWVDVNVNFPQAAVPFTTPPSISPLTDVLTDTNDTFVATITADSQWTDFNWNTGDGVRHPNTNVLVHSWATPGKKNVWCWISTRTELQTIVTAHVKVEPTNSNFISVKGYVLNNGLGSRVSVGSKRFTYCSPTGFYQVNNLQEGHAYQLNFGRLGGAAFDPPQRNFIAAQGQWNWQFITASLTNAPNNPPIIENTTLMRGYYHKGADLPLTFKVWDEDNVWPVYVATTNYNFTGLTIPDPLSTINFKHSITWTNLPAGTNVLEVWATDSFGATGTMIHEKISVWDAVVIDGITQTTNGTQLAINANPGQVLQAQVSSNLIDWVGLAYLTNGTGTNTTWLDASTENERFYRMLHVD